MCTCKTPLGPVEHFRAAAHAWFTDGRLISEAIGMALGESTYPLPSAADRQRIHEWIARRHGLTVEEVDALSRLIE